MLSNTAEYALRATIYVAANGSGRLVPVGEIASALEVPSNYLSKILHQLGRAGVLGSVRGPHGGFRLAHTPEQISLNRIVGLFDDVVTERRRCLLGRPECSDINPCGAHNRWKPIASDVQQFFKETTVADVLADGGLGRKSRSRGAR